MIPDFCKYLENWPITEDINVYLVYSVWKVKIAFRSFLVSHGEKYNFSYTVDLVNFVVLYSLTFVKKITFFKTINLT